MPEKPYYSLILLGEEEEDDTSQGLRGPTSVALWPWACSHSLAASFPACNVGGFKWVEIVEFLGFPHPEPPSPAF